MQIASDEDEAQYKLDRYKMLKIWNKTRVSLCYIVD